MSSLETPSKRLEPHVQLLSFGGQRRVYPGKLRLHQGECCTDIPQDTVSILRRGAAVRVQSAGHHLALVDDLKCYVDTCVQLLVTISTEL